MRWIKLIILVALLASASCIDRFIPETTGYEKILFIECLISNDPEQQHVVHVSLAAPVASEAGGRLIFQPEGVSGATVRIDCSDGTRYSFPEKIPGTYTAPSNFHPEAGKSYTLWLSADGQTYESDEQTIRIAPPVDSISHRHILHKNSEDGQVGDGYRFLASTHEDTEGPSWYRWSLEATFQYQAPYIATHIYNGRTQIPASNQLVRTCWKTKTIPGIFIGNSEDLSENRIIEAPLNFESQYGDELTIRYSLRVKQLAISESAYNCWENLSKLVSQTGSLYETQPFRIQGNIRCTSDPSVYVAGIFEVAGVSETRYFVDRPTEFEVVPLECILMQVGTRDFPWYRLPAGSYVTQESPGVFMTASPACYDCRQRMGTLDKPPFWKE